MVQLKTVAFGYSLLWFCAALSPSPPSRVELTSLEGRDLDGKNVRVVLDGNNEALQPAAISRQHDGTVAFALAAEGAVSAEKQVKTDAWSMMRREVDSHEASEQTRSEQAVSEDGHPIPVYIPVPVPVPAPCPPPQAMHSAVHSIWAHGHSHSGTAVNNDPDQTPYGHLVTPENHAPSGSHDLGHSSGIPALGANLTPNPWEGAGPPPDDIHPKDFREDDHTVLNSSSTLAHPKGEDEEAGTKVKPTKVIEVTPDDKEAVPITTPEPPEDVEEKKQEDDADAAAEREVEKSKSEAQFKKDVTEEKKEEETNEWSEKTIVFVSIVSLTACLGFTLIGLIVGATYYYFIARTKDSHAEFDPASADRCAAPESAQAAGAAT